MSSIVIRVRPRVFAGTEASLLVGTALSAAAIVWLLFGVLLPVSGPAPFVAGWLVLFFVEYAVVTRQVEGRLAAKDRVMAALIAIAGMIVIVALASILLFVTLQGIRYLRLHFFTQTMQFTGPEAPATAGGALHAIVGTIEQVFLACLISVPLGVLTAVFLNEVGGRMARPVRMFVNAMSGTPSIVAGMFIYAVLILGLGWGFSGAAAALALSILMLPTVTRTSEEILRLVPGGLREAALALGAPEWRSVWQVVLPTARAGIVTAVILGIARVVGETAPLLLTSVGADTMNANPFSGQQASLPQFVFKQIKQLGRTTTISRGYAGALVLLVIVLILFMGARLIGRARPERRGKTRRRNRRTRKRVQASAAMAAGPADPTGSLGTRRPSAGRHRRRRRRREKQPT